MQVPETDVQFIKDFMKYIELNFRNESPGHKDPIGLDQWWLQGAGNFFCGVTDDIDFYMYLWDDSHYPFSIGNVQIKPEPPKHLPAQNSVVIKFVPTTISKDDVFDEMKSRFSSIFMINKMKGTTRSSARHIRVILKQQNEYKKILYDGRICHHCGGNHISTDYKCPTIVNFRKNLLDKLKNNADKLPVHVRMFIAIDCRKPNDHDLILTFTRSEYSASPITTTGNSSHPPTMNHWTSRQEASKEYLDSAIRAFDNELNKIKKDFDEEKKRINRLYEKQIDTVKKGWLILQQQVRAQNECLASMQQVISTTIDCTVNLSTTNNILCEFVKTVC
ncbi:unnamed protein product [Didymodactylos carnosus]|uniref:Uncharacterized protein n=1 Tax=Didymodactylos carnosus TaxID=1234261 RepID=A0A814EUZ8_9BILA|nr:unnamed protein product [Didymodactylos carnosus]CAF0986154.1 unnamed protein product [Didymodactylos carnosus]CAF3747075.1 unnamed protein product [Didymodactylos carnosus]CAF3756471.1 unnamed protein product [Didymodactylos carnosus]